jgi:O-antigen/teichoic acid export membrane protein
MEQGMAATSAYPRLSLRLNFSWTLAGNLLYAACQWGMLIALAKLTSPEEVGRFALGLAVTAPIFMLCGLQLRAVEATDARREVRFADYVAVRLAGTSLALATALAIAIWGRFPLASRVAIAGIAVAKSIESFSDVLYGLFQQHERMDRIALSMAWRGVLALVLLTAGVWLGRSATWGVLGMVVAWTTVLLAKDIPGHVIDEPRQSDSRSRHERWRCRWNLAMTGFPLGVVMLLISLNVNVPRYFLEAALGERELGIFAALASTLTVGLMVVNALGQSATPRLARLAITGARTEFLQLLWKLLGVAVTLGSAGVLAAVLFGKPVLALVFTPEYARHADVLVALLIGGALGFVGSFLGYTMTALRAFRIQVPLFVIVCGTTALWASRDVPTSGLMGAARSLVAAAVVQLVGSALIVVVHLPRGRVS